MASGEYRVATQAGPRGYFGKVALHVRDSESGRGATVDFDESHATRWQSGARFGIDYVLEHLPKKRELFPKGVAIHVDCIEGHEVDTTNALIAFVAAHALIKALNVTPERQPTLNADEGLILFPK